MDEGWRGFLRRVNQELKQSQPDMTYAERRRTISLQWKNLRDAASIRSAPMEDRSAPMEDRSAPMEDRSAPMEDWVQFETYLATLDKESLAREPTDEMIECGFLPLFKIKDEGKFRNRIASLHWLGLAKIITIAIGQPEHRLACRFIRRILRVVDLRLYKVYYWKMKEQSQEISLLFWCLYELSETQYSLKLLDDMTAADGSDVSEKGGSSRSPPALAAMGMRDIIYDDAEVLYRTRTDEAVSIGILLGRHLKKISLVTLERLIRRISNRAMHLKTPEEDSFFTALFKGLGTYSMVYGMVTQSTILHHLLLDDRCIMTPSLLKILSLVGEEGEKIARGAFRAEINPDTTLAEQYCEYIRKKYGEENLLEVMQQTHLALCFPADTQPPGDGTLWDTIQKTIRLRKTAYEETRRMKMLICEETYLSTRVNQVFFSTQEDITEMDVCFQTHDNCLFSRDEIPYLYQKSINPFTNLPLIEEDIRRIRDISESTRPILEPMRESSSLFCDLGFMKEYRKTHLDLLMNRSIFLGYATKFTVAMDKIFTSHIILNSFLTYMYEPQLLSPRSELTDYRQGFYPLGKFTNLVDEELIVRYWRRVVDTTQKQLTKTERQKYFIWLMVYLMEMYGNWTINLFAHVVENFVMCLPT